MAVNPFKDMESDDPQFALTIKDRLPYTYLLTEQVKTFQKSTLNKDFSRREIEEAIEGLVRMIPDSWKQSDPEWKKDFDEARSEILIDVRPSFAGVKMNLELCEKLDIEIQQKVEVIDYFKLLQAVFNKLNRLNMLSKRDFTEATTGMPEGATALPEGKSFHDFIKDLELDDDEEEEEE